MEKIHNYSHSTKMTPSPETRQSRLSKEDRKEVKNHLRQQRRELFEISLTAQDLREIEQQVQQGIQELKKNGLTLDV